MATRSLRDFGHVPTQQLERLTRRHFGPGDPGSASPSQIAMDYADRHRWRGVIVTSPEQTSAMFTPPNAPRSIEVKGRERARVVMIAALLAAGIDEDEVL